MRIVIQGQLTNTELSSNTLKELFFCDVNTGVFIRKTHIKKGSSIGDIAGTKTRQGYLQIVINQNKYLCHRLVWLYAFGEWPSRQLDHINGIRHDNRLSNLRESDTSANGQNRRSPHPKNTTGLIGVTRGWNNKFVARIGLNKRVISLGTYETAEEAHLAYVKAKRILHASCTI